MKQRKEDRPKDEGGVKELCRMVCGTPIRVSACGLYLFHKAICFLV